MRSFKADIPDTPCELCGREFKWGAWWDWFFIQIAGHGVQVCHKCKQKHEDPGPCTTKT